MQLVDLYHPFFESEWPQLISYWNAYRNAGRGKGTGLTAMLAPCLGSLSPSARGWCRARAVDQWYRDGGLCLVSMRM
jgi:hypothetical protein